MDVRIDLTVLLEQLPDALKAIATRESAEIYLYEQGVDRLLTLEPKDAGYAVHCRSCLLYTSPSPRDRQKSRMPSSA